jgi:hypothetical protein
VPGFAVSAWLVQPLVQREDEDAVTPCWDKGFCCAAS